MAEASTPSCRFFCHRCSTEISPRLPDFTCPLCDSGFIEELPDEPRNENSTPSTSSTNDQTPFQPTMNHQHMFTFPSGYSPFTLGVFNENFELRTWLPTEDNRETEIQREQDTASEHRIIQQLVNGIIAPTGMPNIGIGPWGVLHSNPMDYAWGANGLDAIITQLLNQFENTGPPPADGERIKSLPTVSITEEHVGAGLECPVCKEDYSVEESVRQLPCNHMFHNDCIVPWLEQHDTCPVCRKSLNGQNTATNPPGFSGMNFSPASSSSSSSNSLSNENASSNS
nr:E3 ubiquitin-protein ligase RNF126-like isoform X2 [Nerophis lumbriciformis]